MPRPLRTDAPGEWHHVMNRGAAGQSVFIDDTDREAFIAELAHASGEASQRIHAYCLMGNHFHILTESVDGQLSLFLQLLSGRYTRAFNTRHRRDGALFRGRALTVGVEDNSHLLQASVYIHANPVAAGLCAAAEDWRWSSMRAYLELCEPPAWLATRLIREMVQKDGAVSAYRAFVGGGIDPATAEFYLKAGVGADRSGV